MRKKCPKAILIFDDLVPWLYMSPESTTEKNRE